jgi:hypothetical protein
MSSQPIVRWWEWQFCFSGKLPGYFTLSPSASLTINSTKDLYFGKTDSSVAKGAPSE